MDISNISAQTASNVLWMFGHSGDEPQGVAKMLIRAAQVADTTNKGLLASEYPGMVAAVKMAQESQDGIRTLQGISGQLKAAA